MVILIYYHTSNSCECMGVNGKPCKKPYFFTTSHIRICISTASHVRICIRYYKSHALRLKVCMIKEHHLHSTRLLPLTLLLVLPTRNNTHGNKLVIFSSIALYYGDNYIVSVQTVFPRERMRSGHKTNATSPFTFPRFHLCWSVSD